MNYYKARQRQGGRWDYTCMNDGRIWPIGYCYAYQEPDVYEWPWNLNPADAQKVIDNKDKYHTDGHASEEEACECYKRYALDYNLSLGHKWNNTQRRCQICNEYTELFAQVGSMTTFDLCDKHQDRQSVEKLYEVAECWSSD